MLRIPTKSNRKNFVRRAALRAAPGRTVATVLLMALLLTLAPPIAPNDATASNPYYVSFYTMSDISDTSGIGNIAVPELNYRLEVNPDGTVDNPGAPSKFSERYIAFTGWYTAPQGDPDAKPFTFSGIVSDEMVYAHFREDYLVSFLDGKGNVFLTKSVKPDTAVAAPTADEMLAFTAPANQVFQWWETAPDEQYDFLLDVAQDITLTPKLLAADSYYVFFYSEGTQIPFQAVAEGGYATEPTPPSRAGYDFAGWKTKNELGVLAENNFVFGGATITGDTTLYAQWTPKPVDYTIMLWNEKENIADPGDDTTNYEYYGQYTTKDTANKLSSLSQIDAGTAVTADAIKTAVGAAVAAAKTTAKGKTTDKFNYLNTNADGADSYFIVLSTETLSGDGSTVVNVYLKRKKYTLEFEINQANGTMNIGDKTYTNSGGEKYTLEAKLGQNVAGVWPVRDTATFNTVGAHNFQGWLAKGDSVAYSSRQLTLGSAIASTADDSGNITLSGKWITGGTTIKVHYMFEQLPGVSGGVKLGSKYYVESSEYTQPVFSPASSAYNAKNIEGFTAVSPTAYRSTTGGTFALITGTPPTDQYLFYNRASSALIFVDRDVSYSVARRPGLNYAGIMYGADLSGFEPARAPVRAPEGDKTYTFGGWYLDAGFLQKFTFGGATMPAANLPLFAKWRVSQYTVSVYDYKGAKEPIGEFGRALNERAGNPSDELDSAHRYVVGGEYPLGTFAGWVVALGPGAYAPLSPEIPVTGNMRVYADWEPQVATYDVTYMSDADTPADWTLPADSYDYRLGTTAIAKAPPSYTAQEYTPGDTTFIGWKTISGSTVDYYPGQTITVADNVKLYPVFIPAESVTLVYNSNYTSYLEDPPSELQSEDEIHIPNDVVSVKSFAQAFADDETPSPTPPTGYVFTGWTDDAATTDTPVYAPGSLYKLASDTTLYAQYKRVEVVYLSDPDGNEEYDDYRHPAGVNIGEDYDVLSHEIVASQGNGNWTVDSQQYNFVGWYEPSRPLQSMDQLYNADSKLPINAAVTYLVAMYIVNPKLIYHSNTGDEDMTTSTEQVTELTTVSEYADRTAYDDGDDIWPPEPAGKHFIGWNTAANGTGKWYLPGGVIIPVADTTDLYAQWETVPPPPTLKYVVTFIPTQIASDPTEKSFLVNEESSVTDSGNAVSNPTAKYAADATFLNWERVGDGELFTTDEAINLPISANTTFIARWAMLPSTPSTHYDVFPEVTVETFTAVYDGTSYHNPLEITAAGSAQSLSYVNDGIDYDNPDQPLLDMLLTFFGETSRLIMPLYMTPDSTEWLLGLENRTDVAADDSITFIYVMSGDPGIEVIGGRRLTITPRPLAPAAYYPNIRVGEPGPVFNAGYYSDGAGNTGFELGAYDDINNTGIVASDEDGFANMGIELYTPYTQGAPAGTYGIYARSGYYDSGGNWVGEVVGEYVEDVYVDFYVDGGNYVIDDNEPKNALYLDGNGHAAASSDTTHINKFVKIGSFEVITPYIYTDDPPERPETKTVDDGGEPGVFTDEHIKYVYGYPDGLVKPERSLTRAEASAVFFRLLSEGYRAGVLSHTNEFTDVAPGEWFNTEVSTLVRSGILTGYPDGTFRPNDSVTRAELAAMAVRFAAVMGETGDIDTAYTDTDGHWAQGDIYRASEIGWFNGYPDGSFKPDGFITRAEFVALVNRMLRRAPETAEDLLPDSMKTWPDNTPDKWYYIDMQEATNGHEYERKGKRVPNRDYDYERWTQITDTPDVPPDEP
ncbi:MAG: InlB B-repeat-containing protein [Oscillospiraceae bacterium]|nr:InlB B-repeat-containing protein [Oscillospiraceae bacterium]